VLVIDDLETLKTIADSLRARIFEQLVPEPRTVKEVAARLGLAPSRLYYHVGLLEERDLIRVVDERRVGNLVEKVYRAAAAELEIAQDLLSFDTREGKENINALLASVLDVTREDLLRSLEARTAALGEGATRRLRCTIVTRKTGRLPEIQALELQRKVRALLEEFEASAVGEGWDEGEAHPYALTVALYPHFDFARLDDEATAASAGANVAEGAK
jgi:DNA-binding transcriptional ArsR family regulator